MALEFERIGTERYMQPMGLVADTHIVRADLSETGCSGRGWILNPAFQRGSVWSTKQKIAWIETLLRGLGLPAIFVNRFPKEHPVYGWKEIVIDGQQRLRATAEFMQDEFRVRGEFWGKQSKAFKRGFILAGPICPVVYCTYKTERECAELYLKLLSAGTSHTPEEVHKARMFIDCSKRINDV